MWCMAKAVLTRFMVVPGLIPSTVTLVTMSYMGMLETTQFLAAMATMKFTEEMGETYCMAAMATIAYGLTIQTMIGFGAALETTPP